VGTRGQQQMPALYTLPLAVFTDANRAHWNHPYARRTPTIRLSAGCSSLSLVAQGLINRLVTLVLPRAASHTITPPHVSEGNSNRVCSPSCDEWSCGLGAKIPMPDVPSGTDVFHDRHPLVPETCPRRVGSQAFRHYRWVENGSDGSSLTLPLEWTRCYACLPSLVVAT